MPALTPPRRAFWANSTAASLFHDFTGPLLTADVVAASWQLYIGESTEPTDLQAVVAYEFSDDGITWTTGGDLGSLALTATGWTYASAFTTLSSATKRFVRFGLRANKSANNTLQYARALLILDLRACS